jgi:hypothetical protein
VEEKTPEPDDRERTPPWEPPTDVAPDTPSGEARRELARWVTERPLVVRVTDSDGTSGFSVHRTYVMEFVAAGSFGASGDSAGDSGVVLDFRTAPRIVPSERNFYAAADLILTMYLQGFGTEQVETTVMGPTVLSTLSHGDAWLNSLRRIDVAGIERAVGALKEELAESIAGRGLTYILEYSDEGSRDEQYAVLRSLGFPGDETEMWYIPLPPVLLRNRIAGLLDGYDHEFILNPATRSGRFIDRDKR